MARPKKYATEEERRQAQRISKAESAKKARRKAAGLPEDAAPVHSGAVLTPEQVAEIRRLRETQNYTLATLAKQFGVAEATISNIINHKAW